MLAPPKPSPSWWTTTSSYSRSTSPANTLASISGRCFAVAACSRSVWSSSSAFAPTDPRPSHACRLGQGKCPDSLRVSYAYTQGISLMVVVCDKSGSLNIYLRGRMTKLMRTCGRCSSVSCVLSKRGPKGTYSCILSSTKTNALGGRISNDKII